MPEAAAAAGGFDGAAAALLLGEARRSSTERGTMRRRGRGDSGLLGRGAGVKWWLAAGAAAALSAARACAAGMSPQPSSSHWPRATGGAAEQARPARAAAADDDDDGAMLVESAAVAAPELEPRLSPVTPAVALQGLSRPCALSAPMRAATSLVSAVTAVAPKACCRCRWAARSPVPWNTALQSGTRHRSCGGRALTGRHKLPFVVGVAPARGSR